MDQLMKEAEELAEYTIALRRDFHRHPELGFREVRTAGIVARELSELGLEVQTGIAETGVVGYLEGARPGPVLLLRVDMDALPIQEETGASYASETPGVMHACGHDGHTAVGLTVARLLLRHRDELAGAVKLVFQPAEEGLGGARRMIDEGVLADPRPDYTLSLHLWNTKPFGWLGITPGPAMAASAFFELILQGEGGHGASPHRTRDPVLAAAQVITALQSVVARNVHPLKSAVLSVTALHAGDAFNVIPPQATLRGTIRAFDLEVMQMVLARFEELVRGVSGAMGCTVEINMKGGTPATVNDPEISARLQKVARQLLPADDLDTDERTMGSEDMAYMMAEVPGCYLFVGSANPELGLDAAHHHPRFDFDERALPKSAALLTAAALDLLSDTEKNALK